MEKTIWGLLGSVAIVAAATAPPVEPENGYMVQLPPVYPRVLYIAVSGSQKFLPKEEPVVVEASFQNVRGKNLADAFHASWERARPKNGQGPCRALAVKILVDDTIQRAGTFNVVLNLQPLSQPDAGRWKLQVVQAPATLEVLPLAITRLRWTPGFFQPARPELVLREGSGDTRINLTEAEQWDTTPAKGRMEILGVGNRAGSGFALPEIAAGQGLKQGEVIEYRLHDFPPGKVTHTLRFRAPQLPSPATANVEVETRWPWLYVLIAIVVGLVASWLIKTKLHTYIELQQSKLQASELLNQAQSAWDRVHDGTFRHRLDEPIANLRTARDQTQVDSIRTRHGQLADALKEASADHDLRTQNEQKSRDQLRAVLGQDWDLPQDAINAISLAQSALAPMAGRPVEDRFREFDSDGARDQMAEIRAHLATQIRQVYDHWDRVVQTLDLLSNANAGLPARVVAQTAEALRGAPQYLRHIRRLTDDPGSDAISATLSDYETKLRFVNDLLGSLVLRLELEWQEVTNQLAMVQNHLPHANFFQTLQQNWDGLLQLLRGGAQPPAGRIEIPGLRLRQLQELWVQFFAGQLRDAEMETQVTNREFVKAAARLAVALPAALAAAGRPMLGPPRGGAPAAVVPREIGWSATSQPGRTRFGFVPGFAVLGSVLPYVKPFSVPPTEAIRLAQFVQSVVVGLILIFSLLAGITSNQGLWTDLFGAFGIAFASDVTLDALMTRLRPKA